MSLMSIGPLQINLVTSWVLLWILLWVQKLDKEPSVRRVPRRLFARPWHQHSGDVIRQCSWKNDHAVTLTIAGQYRLGICTRQDTFFMTGRKVVMYDLLTISAAGTRPAQRPMKRPRVVLDSLSLARAPIFHIWMLAAVLHTSDHNHYHSQLLL